MSINEFNNENVIVDPNLQKYLGSQGNSEPQEDVQPYSTTNISSTRRNNIVTPQQMGFTHEEPKKIERPEQSILDNLDVAIARRQNEARLMAQAIEESDGEGITEAEFQDILVQAKDELDVNNIPTEEDLVRETLPHKKEFVSSLPEENPTMNLMDELQAEIEEDEREYAKVNHEPTMEEEVAPYMTDSQKKSYAKEIANANSDNIFENFISGDINFDQEDKDLDENIDENKLAEKEQEKQIDKLRKLVREKIKPVSKAFDISSFSISKRPAVTPVATPRVAKDTIADWVLMSSCRPIYMRRFTGTEMERLSNGGKGRSRLNKALDTWQLIHSHIVDPNKLEMEEWAKATSFLDIDHIYMAIYRANYEGSNYLPYSCTNEHCKEKVFLTDDMDIMSMCKFSDDKAKEKFNSILGSEIPVNNNLYSTEVIPVSEDYAFVFREPSIYNIIFETAVLDQEFVDKFGDLISMCSYIDEIYYINRETMELQPVRTNIYPNNMKKTVKSRIINYSKYISTLNSDQYNTIMAYMRKINESGDELTYELPEVTCPHCKTTIEAKQQSAQSLVFTRHQLAALATL